MLFVQPMLDDVQKFLEEIGFTEREARVYLDVLVAGETSAQEVADRLSLPRPSCYDALQGLAARSFVSESETDRGRRFRAEAPERLRDILALQMRELSVRQREAEEMLPRLTALHQRATAPVSVRYLRGRDAFLRLQKEIEEMNGDILQLVGYDAFLQLHDAALSAQHREQLVRRGRRVRAMLITRRAPSTVTAPDGVETRIIPPEIVESMGEMVVCEDRLICFGYDADITVLDIRSPAIVSAARAALELAWRQAASITNVLV